MNRTIQGRENIIERQPNETVTKSDISSRTAKGVGLSQPTRGAGLSHFTKGMGISQPLQEKARSILSDKSNNVKKTYGSLLKSTQIPGGNKLEVSDDAQAKKKNTQQEADAIQAALVKDFFEDNKSRYEENSEAHISIVPIVSIKVPDSVKPMLRKRIFMQQNRKRPREEQDNEGIKPYKNIDTQLNAPLVHLDNHNETLGFNDGQELQPHDLVPKHLQLELNDEAIAFDKKQDLRAQSVMLQMKSSFEEVQCNDPMMVAEYTVEIFERLKMAENDYRPDANYIDKIQREITWSTRGVLIDWVIEIHYLFSLLPETLFLAINIIDRFLSVRRVALAKLQLVGAAALFVATKFEEMYCPSLEDFLSTTDGQIDEDEFVRAECLVLQVLDFHICYANPLNFLRRLLAIDGDDQRSTRILSKYLMEVCAIDHRTMAIKPSLAAAASVCLARRMLGRTKWPAELEKLSGYTIHDLKPVVEDTLDYLSQPVVHDAFFKKWFSKRLSRVSIFARDWVNSYYIA